MNVRPFSFDRDGLADWRRRLPAFVEVALVLLLATQAARLLWMLLVSAAPVGTAAAIVPTQAVATALPVADVFFRRAGSGPLREGGASEALGYTLHGVRSDGSGGSAILGKGGRQASHAVGREVAPGITLEAVGADHAVLVSGGERHRLQLPRHSARPAASRPATLPTGARATATAPASSSAPEAPTTPAPAATANPRKPPPGSGLARQAHDGHTITSGGDSALLRHAGLQVGDVVTSVNGRPLDPTRLAGLKDELDGQSQVTIQYRRDGKTHTTTVKAPQ